MKARIRKTGEIVDVIAFNLPKPVLKRIGCAMWIPRGLISYRNSTL